MTTDPVTPHVAKRFAMPAVLVYSPERSAFTQERARAIASTSSRSALRCGSAAAPPGMRISLRARAVTGGKERRTSAEGLAGDAPFVRRPDRKHCERFLASA